MITGQSVQALNPKFAVIDGALSGDNEIVAAVLGKRIVVLAGLLVMSGTTVEIRFESGPGGRALTGRMDVGKAGVVPIAYSPVGHFWTEVGESLNMELSGAQSVDGWIVYVESFDY